jgi:hypothetical protein
LRNGDSRQWEAICQEEVCMSCKSGLIRDEGACMVMAHDPHDRPD